MPDRLYKILEKGFHIFFYIILIGLFLKGEVFRVHTKWISLTFTSVKNLIPVFIIWWAILNVSPVRSKPPQGGCRHPRFWLGGRTSNGVRKKPKISLWLLFILILEIISILFSKYPAGSLKAGLVLLIYIFWFYSIWDVFKKERFLINTAVLIICLAGLINISDLFFHYSVGLGEIIETYPFWQGKNALGLFLVMALCIAGSFMYGSKWKIPGVINSVLFVIGIVFSYSRSAWISGLAAFAGLALYRFKRVLWIIILCGIVFLIISPSFVFERFNSIFEKSDLNIKQRLEVWNHCLDMAKQRPIIGTGLGTFTEAYRDHYPNSVPVNGEGARIIRHAHNLYLQILVETGVLGLASFVFLVITGFICSIKNIIKEQDQIIKSIRYGSLLGVFVFLVYSITDCTASWQFMGDSFSHINLIWVLFWAISLRATDFTV